MATTRKVKVVLEAEDRASKKIGGVGLSMKQLGAIAAAVGAAQIGRKFVQGVTEAVNAAAKYESASVRLGVALTNQGNSSEASRRGLLDFARDLQRVSLATETQIVGALAQATALGASEEAAKALTQAATDLASATGVDLETAFRQANRTLGGYAGELGEIIPELKTLTTEQLRAGKAAEIIARQMGGAGAAGAKTFEGAVNNLNSAMDSLKVTMGAPVRDALKIIITEMTALVDETNKAVSATDRYRIAMIEFQADIVDIAAALAKVNPFALEFAARLEVAAQKIRNLKESGGDPGGTGAAGIQDLNDGLTETIEIIGRGFVTANDAVNLWVEGGLLYARGALERMNADVEGMGQTMNRVFRGSAVYAAESFSSALVDAAFSGEFAFDKFFKNLLRDIATAITQALILRAVLSATGLGFGGGGGGAAAAPVAAHGLIIPGGNIGRDNVPVLAQPGEAILPRELTEYLLSAAAGSGGAQVVQVEMGPNMAALADSLSVNVRRGSARLIASETFGNRATR